MEHVQREGRNVLSEDRDLPDSLTHVLWIGGTPDSGKTTIAANLAERHGLEVYHFDRHEMDHFRRADPENQPALTAAHPDLMGPEERWLGSSPEDMASETIACWTERFWMTVDDLLEMPMDRTIVVEGPGLFPDCVAPLIADRAKAVWLVPCEKFKRESVARREKLKGVPVSDLEQARENLIQRDLLMGKHVTERASDLGLTVYEVDGSKNLDEVTAFVESHLAANL